MLKFVYRRGAKRAREERARLSQHAIWAGAKIFLAAFALKNT